MTLTLHVLSIEDNPVDAYLIRAAFDRIRARAFQLVQVGTLAEGLQQLAKEPQQIVLLDLSLPDAQGIASVRQIREADPTVPILVLTGSDDETLALRALQAGAQDYLVKGHFDVTMLDSMVLHAIERQRLALALDRARRRDIERRDEFLSHVSHELRTPLAAIEQFASILGDGLMGALNEEQWQCSEVLLRNAKQLRRMVDELLEVSRVDSGKLTLDRSRVDLGAVLRETLVGFAARAESRQIVLLTDLPEKLVVHADPMRIAQVLGNLCENAFKFTPGGGTVTVTAATAADDPGQVEIAVTDTGCGIEATELQAIFERLVQLEGGGSASSRRGLGLGLYISREIVQAHGGWMWAESRPGRGSSFRFTLPVWTLDRVLAPLLEQGSSTNEPLQLLRVAARDRRAATAAVPQRAREALDELLRRAAAEAGGVLLPAEDGAALVVLRISGTRLPNLLRRLRQRFARHPALDGRALRLTVQRTLLAGGGRLADGTRASLAARLLRQLGRQSAPTAAAACQHRQAGNTKSTSTL